MAIFSAMYRRGFIVGFGVATEQYRASPAAADVVHPAAAVRTAAGRQIVLAQVFLLVHLHPPAAGVPRSGGNTSLAFQTRGHAALCTSGGRNGCSI
jgi:hypothetical protein